MDFNFLNFFKSSPPKARGFTKAPEKSIQFIPEANPWVQINLPLFGQEQGLPPLITADYVIAQVIDSIKNGENRFEIICGKNKQPQAEGDATQLTSDSARQTIENRTGVSVTNDKTYLDGLNRIVVIIDAEHL